MADADKPEVLRAAGDDSPHRQPAEPPGEPRREAHPPEQEKQPPQHSSSSNGVKMYCLFLWGPGRGGGGGREVDRGGAHAGLSLGPWAAGGAGAAGPLPDPPRPPRSGGSRVWAWGLAPLPCFWPRTASHPFFPDFGWKTFKQSSAAATVCRKMVPLLKASS